jgi:hypothetical protein
MTSALDVSGQLHAPAASPSVSFLQKSGRASELILSLWRRKYYLPPAGNATPVPLSSSPQPNHYTDWAIPAQVFKRAVWWRQYISKRALFDGARHEMLLQFTSGNILLITWSSISEYWPCVFVHPSQSSCVWGLLIRGSGLVDKAVHPAVIGPQSGRENIHTRGSLLRVFGPKRDEVIGGWRKLHNEELHNLYSSPSIIRMIKSRGWDGQGM